MANSRKKPNAMRKLNFEDSEVRKEESEEILKLDQVDSFNDADATDKIKAPTKPENNSDSPVLLWKKSSCKRDQPSPDLMSKRRINKRKRYFDGLRSSSDDEPSSSIVSGHCSGISTSPVLNVRNVRKGRSIMEELRGSTMKKKLADDVGSTESPVEDDIFECTPEEGSPSVTIQNFPTPSSTKKDFSDFENSPLETCMHIEEYDDDDNPYIIEEYTEEVFAGEKRKRAMSLETKISTFSTESKETQSSSSNENQDAELPEPTCKTPPKEFVVVEELEAQNSDSGRKKKRIKKGGLLERLHFIKKREASERRIREHKRTIMKAAENWKKTLYVVDGWLDGSRFMVKCLQFEVDNPDPDLLHLGYFYVLIDRNQGEDHRKIEPGTFFRIAPPWQEMRLFNINANLIMSVGALQVINPVLNVTVPNLETQEESVSQYNENDRLLYEKLHDSPFSVLLCK